MEKLQDFIINIAITFQIEHQLAHDNSMAVYPVVCKVNKLVNGSLQPCEILR